jgi:hypothetical protein
MDFISNGLKFGFGIGLVKVCQILDSKSYFGIGFG